MKNGLTEAQMEEMKAMGVKFYESPEEQELDYLREGLRRSDEERFLYLMKLMNIGRLLKQAKLVAKN